MHRHTRPAVLGAAAVLLAASIGANGQEIPRTTPESVGMSSERLDRLTGALQAYVDEGRLPGAVATVLRDGHVVYSTAVGYRDRETVDPMTEDAIFRIASQTKAIVSVGVMMLQEEGALLIGDPVSKHLPSFEETTVAEPDGNGGYTVEPARRPITIRDLLTHTAGIGYGYGPGADRWETAGIQGWYFGHLDEPIRMTVDRLAALPFDRQPGDAYVYGYNTDILGAVIEAVSGQPLDAFLRERILEPLDMRDTHFYLPPDKRDRLAVVYNLDGSLDRAPEGPGMQTQGEYVDGPRRSFSGGAGLLSTARDYARFLQMLLDGGELDGVRLLAPTSVDLMTRNHVGSLFTEAFGGPGVGFGLGFSIREDVGAAGAPGSRGEYAWGGAYHSTYWVDPQEGLVVVYFTQVIPAAGLDDHGRLRALVYAAITESRAH
ncbi:MAG: serine hydrolase domain-containing protein [Gemmatimonadota bacterium]|nr:serine hydrolase domain-containing protein [Gemmatimonadota bacterium]